MCGCLAGTVVPNSTNVQMCGLTCLQLGWGFCLVLKNFDHAKSGSFGCQVLVLSLLVRLVREVWGVCVERHRAGAMREEGHELPEITRRHRGADLSHRSPVL